MPSAKKPVLTGVVACVTPHRKTRLRAALGDTAEITWYASFAELTLAVAAAGGCSVAILDATDALGRTAALAAADLSQVSSAVAVVLYATHQEIVAGGIASPAITDLIIADETDGKVFVQAIVLDAVKRRAADRVVVALRARLSQSLAAFAEWAVRHPSCNTVEALADEVGIHRQTAAVWCRKERFLRPEELLIWCRLLLVAAILEQTNYPVASLAMDLEFPSVISLRNQLKRYTGLTGLEIRSAGFDTVLQRFDARVAQVRGAASSPELRVAR